MFKFNWADVINTVWYLITLLIPFIAVKVHLIAKAVKESTDVTTAFVDALKDDKFTQEEIDLIIKEINEAQNAWKEVFAGKKK